jgi:hypothetical protein
MRRRPITRTDVRLLLRASRLLRLRLDILRRTGDPQLAELAAEASALISALGEALAAATGLRERYPRP